MSSDSPVRNGAAENPRFPPQCQSAEGKSVLRVFLALMGSNSMDKSLIFDYRLCVCKGVTKVEALSRV